jgi:hypothetical protein
MAGDWMKMELTLPDKPEVHYIANALNIDPDAVIGKLLRVWAWFDMHTENGNALGVTFALVDRLTCVSGFGEAMQFAGWLEQRDNQLCMVNFDRHTSESAKKRALTAKRQSKFRNAPVTQPVTLPALPREEKRREDIPVKKDGNKTSIPDNWVPSERIVEKLATEYGMQSKHLEICVAVFRDSCKAKNYKYANFDSAFANSVRSDWAKLRNGAAVFPTADKPSHHASW